MKTQRGVALFLAATVLASGVQVASSLLVTSPANAAVTDTQMNVAVQQMLKDTNAARAKAGLKPLVLTPSMSSVAQNWSMKMANAKNLNSNPNYDTEIPKHANAVGETVGRCAGLAYTQAVSGWMNFPDSRSEILNPAYTNIGIGYYVDSNGLAWYTQDFAGYPPVTAPAQIQELNEWNGDISYYANGFHASWYDQTDVDDYKVDLYKGTSLVKSFVTTDPHLWMDGLQESSDYTLNITARNTDYTGKVYSAPVRSTKFTTETPLAGADPVSAPYPVSNLSVTATNEDPYEKVGIAATWDYPSDYAGSLWSNIITVKEAGKPDRVIQTGANGDDISDLSENTVYTIEVKSLILGYDRKSLISTPTVSKTVKTPYSIDTAKVGTPTNVKITNLKDTSMTASWTAPTGTIGNLTQYSVLVQQGTKVVKSVTTTQLTYNFTGLTAGVAYTVGVIAHAVSPSGRHEVLSPVAAMAPFTTTTLSVARVGTPVVAVSGVGRDRMTVSWKKPSVIGALTGYKVTVKQGTRIVRSYTASSAAISQVVTGLLRNTAYSVVVEADVISQDRKATGKAVSLAKSVTTVR